jgi:hypothetical protein
MDLCVPVIRPGQVRCGVILAELSQNVQLDTEDTLGIIYYGFRHFIFC